MHPTDGDLFRESSLQAISSFISTSTTVRVELCDQAAIYLVNCHVL